MLCDVYVMELLRFENDTNLLRLKLCALMLRKSCVVKLFRFEPLTVSDASLSDVYVELR